MALDFSGEVCIRRNEKGLSPELPTLGRSLG
jgi:hypothetical protein